MSMVDQEAFLFDDSISDNVRAGRLDASQQEIEQALETAEAEFVHDLPNGIGMSVGEAGGRLSGGEAPAHRSGTGLSEEFTDSASR